MIREEVSRDECCNDCRAVAAMAAAPAGQPLGEAMDAFIGEQAGLAAHGIPEGIIAAGALLPDADLLDPFRAAATLHGAVGNQPAVGA